LTAGSEDVPIQVEVHSNSDYVIEVCTTGPDHLNTARRMSVKSWASEHFFAILRGPHTGVLTTSFSDGSSWSTPVWFSLDGEDISLSTAAGKQKPRNVAPNARTTFAVCDPENEMRFIKVRGTITVTDDFVCDIRDRIVQKHGDENGSALDAPGTTLHRRRSCVPSTVIFSPS
jgi:hypothetical protein